MCARSCNPFAEAWFGRGKWDTRTLNTHMHIHTQRDTCQCSLKLSPHSHCISFQPKTVVVCSDCCWHGYMYIFGYSRCFSKGVLVHLKMMIHWESVLSFVLPQPLIHLMGSDDHELQEAAAGCVRNIRLLALANRKAQLFYWQSMITAPLESQ